MNKKAEMKKLIHEFDFALHELNLYLDTHPTSLKALELLKEYRRKREETVAAYEKHFGEYINTVNDVPVTACWKWLKGPWPWENNFLEGN